MRNSPTGHMKPHQEQGMINVLSKSCHIRHDKGGGDRKDRPTLIETNASAVQLLFDRGLSKATKCIAPWKRFGKQFGKVLIEFIKPSFGIGSIGEKAVILGLGQGQTDRTVSFFGRMRYRGHPCLDVRR